MNVDKIKELDRFHIMHSWTVNATSDPLVIADVEGPFLILGDGRRLFDFSCGSMCVNAGHKNQKIVKAIKEQAENICYIRPAFTCESRVTLGKELAEITPGDLNKFFFTLSGAESNENAIKMARFYTKKHKILARYRSYHGATYGAVTLTGDPRRIPAEPGIPGVIHVFDPYCYRCPFGLTYPKCGIHCAETLKDVIMYENPDTVAAIILETIVGSGGIIIPPDGYLRSVRKICDEHNILLITDEIMAGFGRTGKWFAVEHWDVVPDLMTMAKGLTMGYIPLGAVAISSKVSSVLEEQMLSCGLTYAAHPLSCAAATAAINVYKEENLIENSQNMGNVLREELDKLKEKHACVGDVRTIGLFACLELVKDKKNKLPLVPYNAKGKDAALAKEISMRLIDKGLFTVVRWMFLFICPPLNIREDELKRGIGIIDEVLDFADTLTEN